MSNLDVERRESEPIALVLLDEHPLTRVGVRNVLDRELDIEVVAETETVDEAVRACRRHRPDVVLMDIDVAPAELADAIRSIHVEDQATAVIVMTRRDSDSELYRSAVAGAAGHLSDVVQPAVLTATIRRAAHGAEPISDAIAERPEVGRRVIETLRGLATHDGAPAAQPGVPNARQVEILGHAARGLTNQQIARRMGLSASTVRLEIAALLGSLGLRHRTQAVVHAVREGWIRLS